MRQWRIQHHRMLGPKINIKPRQYQFKKTMRGFFAAIVAKFWRHQINSTTECRDFWAFFCCWNPSRKDFFWYIIIKFLRVNCCRQITPCQLLSLQRRAAAVLDVTCLLKQSNFSAWSLLSWHLAHTHMWGSLSVFFKAVCSPPSRRVTEIMWIEHI